MLFYFALCVVFILSIVIRLRDEPKGQKFNGKTFMDILQAFAIFFTLGFSVYSIKSSISSTNQTVSAVDKVEEATLGVAYSLDELNSSLRELPNLIDSVSINVGRINSSLHIQQQEMNKKVSLLNESIDVFSKGVSEYNEKMTIYGIKLDELVNTSSSHLDLINSQYSKVPKFLTHISSSRVKNGIRKVKNIEITNYGDITGEIDYVLLKFHSKPISFQSKNCTESSSTSTFTTFVKFHKYSCTENNLNSGWFKMSPNTAIKIPVEFEVNEKVKSIEYEIVFTSKYLDSKDKGKLSLER